MPDTSSIVSQSHLCVHNSTTTPLGAGATFTGEWEDTLDYGTMVIGIISDQDSATDGLKIEYSADGITKIQDSVAAGFDIVLVDN